MDRSELERLDRDALIARAEAAGVTRARILTRPELVDEVLLRTSRGDDLTRVRGLFGRARDLLARVIERGLHLPDAADRLRHKTQPPFSRSAAQPLPTVTLAEIYAAQGHRQRAVETLRTLLGSEPEHEAARALLERLEDDEYRGPAPRALPVEDEEPPAATAEAPAPDVETSSTADVDRVPAEAFAPVVEPAARDRAVDACVVLPVGDTRALVYWEVEGSVRSYDESSRAAGSMALRVLIVAPAWDGPRAQMRDLDVADEVGDALLETLPERCVVRAAIGWRVQERFIPFAHSPALVPASMNGEPWIADGLLRWTPRGATPVVPTDRDAPSIERALAVARARAGVPPAHAPERSRATG